MKKSNILLFFFLVSLPICPQNPEWINYTYGQEVKATVIEGSNVWVGTNGGLVKINKMSSL